MSSVPAGADRARKQTPPERQESSGSCVVGRSAYRQRLFGLGRLFLSFFLVGRLVSRRDLFMNAWTPHAHGLLGAVVVVVATLFQGVGVEAPRAAALRRRAAEAPLVMSRQALAGAQRSARAAHHLESCWLRRSYAAQRRRRSATSLRDYLRASVL